MKKQTIAIILLLSIGSISSVAYSANTIVDNTSVSTTTVNTVDATASNHITTKDMTITGTCSGCGGGSTEGDYSSYNLIYNASSIIIGAERIFSVLVSNDGIATITENQDGICTLINSTGSVLFTSGNGRCNGWGSTDSIGSAINQSLTGKYKTVLVYNNADPTTYIGVFKNNALLVNMTSIDFLDVSGFFPSIAISPNGKYIAEIGEDNSLGNTRILFWQGVP